MEWNRSLRCQELAKTAGRQRGTPNRATYELAAKLDKLGCDTILGIAEIAMSPETTSELRVRCNAELAHYVHAKRKAVEIRPEDDHENPRDHRTHWCLDFLGHRCTRAGDAHTFIPSAGMY